MTADAFPQERMAKICASFLQGFIRHMVNHARRFLFKKSVMPNSELKGTHRYAILLSMGTRAFLFLGMSLLVFERQADVFRGNANFRCKTQPCVARTRGCLRLTPTSQRRGLQVKWFQDTAASDRPPLGSALLFTICLCQSTWERLSPVDNWLF